MGGLKHLANVRKALTPISLSVLVLMGPTSPPAPLRTFFMDSPFPHLRYYLHFWSIPNASSSWSTLAVYHARLSPVRSIYSFRLGSVCGRAHWGVKTFPLCLYGQFTNFPGVPYVIQWKWNVMKVWLRMMKANLITIIPGIVFCSWLCK